MIALLTGSIVEQSLNHIILGVGGVGYSVHVPVGTQGKLKPNKDKQVTIHIHTHVREDALMLYGFASRELKTVFEKLTSVSGVGAKMALAVLSTLDPSELVTAIETNDVSALTKVSGVGKKTAQRLILELKSKLDADTLGAIAPSSAGGQKTEEFKSALKNLGFDPKVVDDLAKKLKDDLASADVSLDDLVRRALKVM